MTSCGLLAPECWLETTAPDTMDWDTGASTWRIQLNDVQSVTQTYRVTLADAGMIVRPSRDRFCMDMGVTRQIRLDVKRVTPAVVNDDLTQSDGLDASRQWSNSKWMKELKRMLDRWQNRTYSEDGTTMVGGFRLHYAPGEGAEELYPPIDVNVFLTGQVEFSMDYSLNVTLTLVAARMNITQADRWNLRFARATWDNGTYADSFTKTVLTTSMFVELPTIPERWGTLGNWTVRASVDGASRPFVLDPGRYSPSTTTLIAKDGSGVRAKLSQILGSAPTVEFIATPQGNPVTAVLNRDGQWEVQSEGQYAIYAVGAGGASPSIRVLGYNYRTKAYGRGTPGAGGEIVRYEEYLGEGDKIVVEIGKGSKSGDGESSESWGVPSNVRVYSRNGGPTRVYVIPNGQTERKLLVTARGGAGGSTYCDGDAEDGEFHFNPEDPDNHCTSNVSSFLPRCTAKPEGADGGCASYPFIGGRQDLAQIPGTKDSVGAIGGGAGISAVEHKYLAPGDGYVYLVRLF